MTASNCWFDPADLAALAEAASRAGTTAPLGVVHVGSTACAERNSPYPAPHSCATLEQQAAWCIDRMVRVCPDAKGAFLADSEGLAIVARNVPTERIAICAEIVAALTRVRAELGDDARYVALRVGAEDMLHLIAGGASNAATVAGLVSTAALTPQAIASVREAIELLNTTIGDDE